MTASFHDRLKQARDLTLGVSVRVKIMGIALGLILLFGSVVILYMRASLSDALTHELEDKGMSMASDLAARSADLILTNNLFALHELVRDTLENNAMTTDLDRAYRQMLRRNRELAALNAIANAVNGPIALDDALARALDTTLEATNLSVGWISLLDGQRGARLVCWRGMSNAMARQEMEINPRSCACDSAIETQQPRVIAPLAQNCPIAALTLADGQPIACHAAVPLISKTEVLGVLNVAAGDAQVFGSDELNLLAAIGHQVGAALENAKLWDTLREKERVRGQLLDKVIGVQEEERKRIARELHDETGQSLTSLLVGLKMVEEAPTLPDAQTHARLVKSLAGDVLDDVRALARELRPSVLDDLGLVAALDRYAREYAHRFNVAVDFQVVGLEERRLPPQYEIALYRIVQEALTNIAKYASAQNVSVLLEHRADSIIAIVEDDGCGFDAEKGLRERSDRQQLGLLGMKERAELLGGNLIIESKVGEGTTVFVQLPLVR